MAFQTHPNLRCPIDDLKLVQHGDSLVCEAQHRFDIGKPGYVNLLVVQQKRTRNPGDSKAMVAARQAFLSRGFYAPIADAITDHITALGSEIRTVVDAGCGDGYYLDHLRHSLSKEPHLIGFDISKWAVQKAARRCAGTWLVASNKRIPIDDNTADVILDMFGFPDFDAFSRVLKHDGHLICVTPSSQHLIELREIIYPEVGVTGAARTYPAAFSPVSAERLTFKIRLEQHDIQNLLLMTPHLFRATRENVARATHLPRLELTVDVAVETRRQIVSADEKGAIG